MNDQKEIDWKLEAERELARAQEIKENARGSMIREAVKAEARALGVIDPDIAALAVDRSKILFDETTGEVLGAREAIFDLHARKPLLFREHGNMNPPPPRRTTQDLLDQIHKELGIK
jgi:hypothetical protein